MFVRCVEQYVLALARSVKAVQRLDEKKNTFSRQCLHSDRRITNKSVNKMSILYRLISLINAFYSVSLSFYLDRLFSRLYCVFSPLFINVDYLSDPIIVKVIRDRKKEQKKHTKRIKLPYFGNQSHFHISISWCDITHLRSGFGFLVYVWLLFLLLSSMRQQERCIYT